MTPKWAKLETHPDREPVEVSEFFRARDAAMAKRTERDSDQDELEGETGDPGERPNGLEENSGV